MSEKFSPNVYIFKAMTIAQFRPLLQHEQPLYSLLFARILEIFFFYRFSFERGSRFEFLLNHWWYCVSQKIFLPHEIPGKMKVMKSLQWTTRAYRCRIIYCVRCCIKESCIPIVLLFLFIFFFLLIVLDSVFSVRPFSFTKKVAHFSRCVISPTVAAIDENAIYFFFSCDVCPFRHAN